MAKKVPGENPFASLLAETRPGEETEKAEGRPRRSAAAGPAPSPADPEAAGGSVPRRPRPEARNVEVRPASGADSVAAPASETAPEPTPRTSSRSRGTAGRSRSRRSTPGRSSAGRSTRAATETDRENRGPRGGKILLLENGRTRANVYVQKDLWEAVRDYARGRMSQSDVVEQALAEYLGFELEGS